MADLDSMLDQAVKQYQPSPATVAPSGGNEDWKLWNDTGGGSPAATPSTWSGKLGLDQPGHEVSKAIVDAAEGAASGAARTVFSGGELIRRGLNAMGVKTEHPINNPEVQQAMAAPPTMAGKVGQFGEQAAEFAGGSGIASGLTKGLTAGAGIVPRMVTGAMLQGGAGAGVSAMQTGGNPTAMGTAAALGAAGPVVGAGVEALGQSGFPQRLYQSALKPTWSMMKNDAGQLIANGVEGGIPVSSAGLATVEKKIQGLRQAINTGIDFHTNAGAEVDTSKVLDSLADLKDFYKNTAAPQKSLDTIQEIEDQFRQYHGQSIPLDKAQQIKINTYQELKDSYGEMASARIEGLKSVARGLKEQIASVFPEIAGLNAEQSKMLDLDNALYRGLWRIENHQMMGIGSPLAAAGGNALMGGPGAVAAFTGKLLLDNPELKSKLAIALSKGGNPNAQQAVNMGLQRVKGLVQAALQPVTQDQGKWGPPPIATLPGTTPAIVGPQGGPPPQFTPQMLR